MRQVAACAALTVAALAAAGCSIGSSSAKDTTASFFQALGDGNGSEACSHVAPNSRAQVLGAIAQGPSQKAAASQANCQQFAKALPPRRKTLFGNVIADPAPSSGGETVNARFETEGGSPTIPYSVRLHKGGDDWRLVSVNSGGSP